MINNRSLAILPSPDTVPKTLLSNASCARELYFLPARGKNKGLDTVDFLSRVEKQTNQLIVTLIYKACLIVFLCSLDPRLGSQVAYLQTGSVVAPRSSLSAMAGTLSLL